MNTSYNTLKNIKYDLSLKFSVNTKCGPNVANRGFTKQYRQELNICFFPQMRCSCLGTHTKLGDFDFLQIRGNEKSDEKPDKEYICYCHQINETFANI